MPQTLRKTDTRVPRARQLRRSMTDAEKKLWWHLRRNFGTEIHFRRQATIGPFFADFACHTHRLVIEVDGAGHAEDAKVRSDAARTRFLAEQGYRVLRFWNHDVLNEIDAVLTGIHDAIVNTPISFPPPLTPPHHLQALAGGGEQAASSRTGRLS